MKVLIVSTNTMPASPAGPAYIAGAVREAGHSVSVFDCLLAADVTQELETCISGFDPDVIGISIRTVTGMVYDAGAAYHMKRFDNRVFVKGLVDCIRSVTSAPIVPGGSGFNYFGEEWLDYLDLDYGLRGEAELSFPRYLAMLEEGDDIHAVPGCIYREDGRVSRAPRDLIGDLDSTALPAYDLFDLGTYREKGIPAGIFSKRGCAFRCSFCPYSSLEGTRYRLKSPKRVVDEIEGVEEVDGSVRIEFCDNCFNYPWKHAEAICEEMIHRGVRVDWGTIDLKPIDVTDAGLRLFREAGCSYLNLAAETASDKMLGRMHRGYSVQQVRDSLDRLARSDIPYGVSLLIGSPGETVDTIQETFSVLDSFPIPRLSVTIGVNFWTHHQPVLAELVADGEIGEDERLFDEVHYVSRGLPRDYMDRLIHALNEREGCTVYVFKPYAEAGGLARSEGGG